MSTRVMRVLELRSVRGTGGGPEKTILFGAAQADRRRFEVTVCYIRDRRDDTFRLGDRARHLGVKYVEIDESHSLDARVLPQLLQVIREHRIDLVHAHEYKTDLLAWLASQVTGVVSLATVHGWTGQTVRETRLYYPTDKWILARYDRLVAVSSDLKAELVRRGARADRIAVILNGIDPQAFRRDPARQGPVRSALGLSPSDVVIGAVGRVERQKRFDVLLRGLVPIFATRPEVRLVLVGVGSLSNEIERLATDLGVAKQCHFLGHREDIADLHHAFDLFVQSSEYEGTPNAVLEAMAMETPLVMTDAGGSREIAVPDQHGLLVPIGDVEALTSAIGRAIGDADGTRRRAQAARVRVEEELSFERRTRRLEAIYAEMLHA